MSVEEPSIRSLSDEPPDDSGSYVLYWMQQSQRAFHNLALEHAVRLANERDQSVVVGFGLYDRYPDASERAFAFLLEGLAETAEALAERGIKLVLRRGRPDTVALELAKDASLVVCDRGYLRHQRKWRAGVARRARRLDDVAIAVAVGLCVGKPVGILVASFLVVRTGIATLPSGVTWGMLLAGGLLAGIGFTMALFISGLALEGASLEAAKAGVLGGSVVAGALGMLVLVSSTRPSR